MLLDLLILETASPRTHKPKIVNESLPLDLRFMVNLDHFPMTLGIGSGRSVTLPCNLHLS